MFFEKKNLRAWLPLVIGLSIIFFIIAKFKPNSIARNIIEIDLKLFLLALLVFFVFCLLYGYRWKKTLEPLCISPSSLTLTKIILMGTSINGVLPGRIGDVARAYYLSENEKIDFTLGFPTIIIEKFLDMAVLFLLSVSCFYFLFDKDLPKIVEGGLLFAMILISLFVLLFLSSVFKPILIEKINTFLSNLLYIFLSFFDKEKAGVWKDNAKIKFDAINKNLGVIIRNPRNLFLPLTITLIAWLVLDLFFFLVVESFHLSYPFSKVSIVFFTSMLLGFIIPITPGGLGTVEIVFTTLFVIVLDTPETLAISVVLVSRLIMYWLVILAGAILIIQSSKMKSVLIEINR